MENIDPSIIRGILTTATPLIKSVIETFVHPKLEQLKKRFSTDYNKYHVPTEEHFSEYLHRTYKKLSIVNTLVFSNSQKLLKEIYQPLTISSEGQEFIERYKVKSFPQELLSNCNRILITDNAGMGKSTLLKKIFLDAINEKQGIPILVELRRLSKEHKIIHEIQEQINSLVKDFDKNLLGELLYEGGFLILLDGYDEIAISEKEEVTLDVQSFISKAANNFFVLTSRPENALTSFGEFRGYHIEPLEQKEAYQLLKKYDKSGTVSKALIKKLQEPGMHGVKEFLANPLLVSLLFTAYQYKQQIPFKKHIFYRQVYDANFERHDLSKGGAYIHNKYSGLDIDEFHKVLRHLGILCLKEQKIEFSEDEILDLLRRVKLVCTELKFKESYFLKDILVTVPLFIADGLHYKWAHKSIQEYFAAQYIYMDTKEAQSKILLSMYNDKNIDKYINVLDLYYDMDVSTFRNTILYEFLKEYRDFYESTYRGISRELIPEPLIKERKEQMFLLGVSFFKTLFDDNFELYSDLHDNKYDGGGASVYRRWGEVDTLCCTYSVSPKYSIFSILNSRNPGLIEGFYVNNRHESLQFNANHIEEYYFLYYLTDESDCLFNAPDNFSKVTGYIEDAKMAGFRVRSEKAFKLLDEIEIEKSNVERFSIF
ncbi:MAG: NACHT domain-containing protein [Flavobacteriales bacterium]